MPEVERQEVMTGADVSPLSLPADDALRQAIEGQRRAEELQREPQPMTVEAYVDAMPGLSVHKREFLKRNTELLQPEHSELMRAAYAEALQAGIPDDTEAMNGFLLKSVGGEMQLRRQRLADAARAAVDSMQSSQTPLPSVERGAEQLADEADAYRKAYDAEQAMPMEVVQQLPPLPQATRARSIPMTAPVSREVPMASGRRMGGGSQITLNAEERFIARHSFSDPNLSDAERERLYATMKAKLARERAEGRYPERERG
nr:hypothetical protein CIT39_15010 [Bradyrhizobium symbiodeficiens]